MQDEERPVSVLAFAGSLRRGSYNRMLLAAAVELAPPTLAIETFDLREIPLYDGDLDTDAARPEPVTRFKQAIADADAVLVVSPEYNHSVPGVTQNAIDWASRPGGRSVLAGKPAGIMGTSGGPVGTARGQQVLKLVLNSTQSLLVPHGGVVVGMAADKFADGRLTHEPTRQFVAGYLAALEAWTRRMMAGVEPSGAVAGR